jgi:hypothetical protein
MPIFTVIDAVTKGLAFETLYAENLATPEVDEGTITKVFAVLSRVKTLPVVVVAYTLETPEGGAGKKGEPLLEVLSIAADVVLIVEDVPPVKL